MAGNGVEDLAGELAHEIARLRLHRVLEYD